VPDQMNTAANLPFDMHAAKKHLSSNDERLAEIIHAAAEFQIQSDGTESPYEVLVDWMWFV
jgi:hypothetical protein